MRKQILRRLKALERSADREIFADAFSCAIAYYLGGAQHFSDVPEALARAMGYQDLEEMCEELAEVLFKPVSLDKA